MATFLKPRKHKKKKRSSDWDCCIADAAFDPCYVATAAHGDFDAPEVLTLRRYRDQRLMVRPAGRAFSRFYYYFGRYPAAVILRYPVLRAPARAVLRPAIWWASRKIS